LINISGFYSVFIWCLHYVISFLFCSNHESGAKTPKAAHHCSMILLSFRFVSLVFFLPSFIIFFFRKSLNQANAQYFSVIAGIELMLFMLLL